MQKSELKKLEDDLDRLFKYYHGWHFFKEYEDLFLYAQMGGEIVVYCTPDYNEDGRVSVQVMRPAEGVVLETSEVPYTGELTAWGLFKIVKPYLDKYSTIS